MGEKELSEKSDVAEHGKSEEALRYSEAQYRSFMQNFQGIAYQGDMNYTPVFFHGAVEKITGYTEAEFTAGKPRWDQVIHPDDFPKIERTAELRTVPGYSTEREYRIIRKGGQIRWVHEIIQNTCDSSGKPIQVQGLLYDITERKNLEEELRREEEQWRTLVEGAADLIFTTDNTGKIASVNRAVCETLGYVAEELLGKSPLDLVHSEERRALAETMLGKMLSGETVHRIELEVLSRDGRSITLEVRGRALYDGSKIVGTLQIARDITERLRMEEKLKALHGLALQLNTASNVDEVVRRALDAIEFTLGFDHADFCLARDGSICIKESRGMPLMVSELPADGPSVIVKAARTKKTLRISDTRKEPAFLDNPATGPRGEILHMMSELTVPILVDEETAAVINVENTRVDAFSEQDQILLETLAADVASALKRLEQREDLENLVTALRESESRYRTLFDSASDGIFIHDMGGRFLEVNQVACERLGYSREELLHMTPKDIDSPEYAALVAERTKQLEKSGRAFFEIAHVRRDGSVVPTELSSRIIDYDGKAAVLSIARDITERKQAEEALRESEEKYRRLFEQAMDGIALADAETGILLDCNQALAALVGRSRAELIGQHQAILHPPASDDSEFSPTFKLHATTRDGQVLETQVITSTGAIREVEIKANLLHLQGRKTLQGIFRDITERKRGEGALRRRAEELAALQATVLDITGSHDLPTLLRTTIERAVRLLGAPAGGMYLCDPEKQEVRCVVSYNTPHDYTGTVLKYGEGAAGIVAQTGRPLIIDDYRSWQGRADVFEEKQPFVAVLTVPMIWQDRVTGVIHVLDETASRRFTQADQELLTLFANHAAIAVENARLLEQEKHHAEELTRYTTSLEQLVLERTTKLSESERKYRSLVENIPDVTWTTDQKGHAIFISPNVTRVYGYAPEEIHDAGDSLWLGRIHPDDLLHVQEAFDALFTRNEAFDVEYRIQRKDGNWIWLHDRSVSAYEKDGVRYADGVFSDITRRRQLEEELRAARDRLEYVVTSNPATIYAGKPRSDYSDYDLTYVSGRASTMLGFEPREFIGHPEFWERHVHPEDIRSVLAEMPRFWKEGQRTFEFRFLHRDGTYRWIRDETKLVRDEAGNPAEVIGYWTDITERKRMEEQLLRSERLASIGETAAMVGHDLRNPLQGITGTIYAAKNMLKSRKPAEKRTVAGLLDMIDEQVMYMDKIVSDLQDYARPLMPEFTETSLPVLVRRTLSAIKVPKTVKVSVEIEKDFPNVMIDPDLTRRVFSNLTMNAIQSMPKGGKMVIRAHRKEDVAILSVEDTGAGIPEENLARLFTPFFTTKAKGQGLGLAVCKRLVEIQGGLITVKSDPGKGSVFTVSIPLGKKAK